MIVIIFVAVINSVAKVACVRLSFCSSIGMCEIIFKNFSSVFEKTRDSVRSEFGLVLFEKKRILVLIL